MRFTYLFVSCLLFIFSCKKSDLDRTQVEEPETIFISARISIPTGVKTTLTAYDIKGAVKWRRSDWDFKPYVPVFADGKLFFTGTSSEFHALDPNTGVTIWKINEPGLYYDGCVVVNNVVYVFATDLNTVFSLRAYNTSTGVPVWDTTMADPPLGMIADGDMIYYFTFPPSVNYGYIVAFNTITKTETWRTPIGSNLLIVNSGLTQTASSIYITDGVGKLNCFNKITGSRVWSTSPGYFGANLSTNKVLSSAGNGRNVVAFEQSTGALAWQTTTAQLFSHSNILNDEIIVTGFENYSSSNYMIEKLDANTGASKWRRLIPSDLGYIPLSLFAGSRFLATRYNMSGPSKLMIYNSDNGNPVDSTQLTDTEIISIRVLTTDGNWIPKR